MQFLVATKYLGWFLLTFGTLTAYTIFAILENHMPVITDMFREWPLAGSGTAGIGSTLLACSLASERKTNIKGLILASCSMWLVIGSSRTFGNAVISWFHDIFTLFFLVFTVYASYELLGNTLWNSTKLQLVSLASSLSAIGCGLALNVDKEIPGGRVALGVSEVLFVFFIGAQYAAIVFDWGKPQSYTATVFVLMASPPAPPVQEEAEKYKKSSESPSEAFCRLFKLDI